MTNCSTPDCGDSVNTKYETVAGKTGFADVTGCTDADVCTFFFFSSNKIQSIKVMMSGPGQIFSLTLVLLAGA